MFKHILVPTDGSALSDETVAKAESFAQDAAAHGEEIAHVAVDYIVEPSASPGRAIIRVAERCGCDLIFMASHARSDISALLLGSETQKVLTECKIPVLVFR
jgi:nucleotide-binding universal stress UspA family protein